MRTANRAVVALVALVLICGAAALSADILVLRDGTRLQGQLVSVQRGVIEFREDRGLRDSSVIQVPRDEVLRIDFEQPRAVDDRGRGREGEGRGMEGRGPLGRGRPNGLREREVWVSATALWTDTGLDVRDGQVVYFTTHGGDIEWRRGVRTRADGDPNAPYSPRRPIPGRPAGALIAKVGGNSGDYFFLGDDEGPVRMRTGGRLFLGINDDNLADNRGAFRVTVYF